MASSLAIGDFSRATHMSIKTLRHYHRVELLEPADVDEFTGHRRYTPDQIPTAQVIKRFRDLDMPIEDIRRVLAAPDVATRNRLIAGHLDRLEAGLARTQQAVGSLRDLLDHPQDAVRADISHRSVAPGPGRGHHRRGQHGGRQRLVPGCGGRTARHDRGPGRGGRRPAGRDL